VTDLPIPVADVVAAGSAGAVYDRGYRPYDGRRGGRRDAVAALFRTTVRRALGLRRSWRQKVFPWSLLVIATVPAVVNVGIAYLTRDTRLEAIELITYREYVGVSVALLLFVGLTAPDVICPDRRQRVLPLIFARPLVGRDYVMAKVGAIFAIVFAFGLLPQIVLFIGRMLVSDGALDYFTGNLEVLWQVPVAVALLAVYYAVIGVAAASLTTRRVVGGAIVVGLLLITSTIAEVVQGTSNASLGAVINVLALPLHLRDLVFLGEADPAGPLADIDGGMVAAVGVYVFVLTTGLTILLRRYRWVEL
jgi:ABC-2 type transport system permease protein